jgi:threonine dehydratase
VPDHPGGLAALLSRVAETGANLVSIHHIRDAGERGFHETRVQMILELRGSEHRDTVLKSLADSGYEVLVLSDL